MPYCPTCKQAFGSNTTQCPTHHLALVDELPFQTVDGPSSTWVEIESVGTEDEARLLKGFLEAQGIPAQIESLKLSELPANLGKMSEIRIYVNAENEREAHALVRERRQEYERLRGEDSIVTDDGPAEIDEMEEEVSETEPA